MLAGGCWDPTYHTTSIFLLQLTPLQIIQPHSPSNTTSWSNHSPRNHGCFLCQWGFEVFSILIKVVPSTPSIVCKEMLGLSSLSHSASSTTVTSSSAIASFCSEGNTSPWWTYQDSKNNDSKLYDQLLLQLKISMFLMNSWGKKGCYLLSLLLTSLLARTHFLLMRSCWTSSYLDTFYCITASGSHVTHVLGSHFPLITSSKLYFLWTCQAASFSHGSWLNKRTGSTYSSCRPAK